MKKGMQPTVFITILVILLTLMVLDNKNEHSVSQRISAQK